MQQQHERRPNTEQATTALDRPLGNPVVDWFWRMLKGIIIGIGAIVPGLSGGVLMVVFGIYDRLLDFLAHLRRRFLAQMAYFLPIGIGGLIGIFLFSVVIDRAFGRYEAIFVCLFIAFVVGTLPALNLTATREGRRAREIVVFLLAAASIFAMMMLGERQMTELQPNFGIWIFSGVLVGLGFIVPGLSPSNFLIYFGLYQKMADGIKRVDLAVIVPLMIGVVLVILLFSKLVHWLFTRYHSVMYHIILGTVVGSSLAIFPTIVFPAFTPEGQAKTGLGFGATLFWCALLFVIGLVSSLLFSRFEARYRPD